MEMRVRRAAASKAALPRSAKGLAVGFIQGSGAGYGGRRMVRRNNFILGSASARVKENLVHRTKGLHSQCIIFLKCNKMKHLTLFPKRDKRLRTCPP
jgi:hypothetical protein